MMMAQLMNEVEMKTTRSELMKLLVLRNLLLPLPLLHTELVE